jgi:hypothetical protein
MVRAETQVGRWPSRISRIDPPQKGIERKLVVGIKPTANGLQIL